jgi:hypothetical protein
VTEAAVANIHPLLFHDALICAAARATSSSRF